MATLRRAPDHEAAADVWGTSVALSPGQGVLLHLLRTRRPERYGKWMDQMLAPDAEDPDSDPAIRLEGGLDRIEWQAGEYPDADVDGDATGPDPSQDDGRHDHGQ